MTVVAFDDDRACGWLETESNFTLREFEAEQNECVFDDFSERATRVEARGGFGEIEHACDDGFQLVEFFTDDAHVGVAGIFWGEIDPEAAVEEFKDRERVADFVGDLGGKEAEGGEAFVFAEGIFALENAGVEAGILQGDGAERGEGGEEAFLVVIKAVDAIREDGEDAENFAFVAERRSEGGNERGVEG